MFGALEKKICKIKSMSFIKQYAVYLTQKIRQGKLDKGDHLPGKH